MLAKQGHILWPASCFALRLLLFLHLLLSLNLRCAPSTVITVMRNCCLSADKSSPHRRRLQSAGLNRPNWRGSFAVRDRPSHFVASRIPHPTMLDNEEVTRPRELTQNPLRKIWMPCKNGHIVQRRGKEGAAGRQMMRAGGMCVACTNKRTRLFPLWTRCGCNRGDLRRLGAAVAHCRFPAAH